MPSAHNIQATMDAFAHAVVARFGDHVMGLNVAGGRSDSFWEHAVDAAGDRVLESLITGGAELPTPGGARCEGSRSRRPREEYLTHPVRISVQWWAASRHSGAA